MGLSKAKRQMLIGAIAVMGPSGSGKTLGSLLIAQGMMREKYPDATDEEIWDKIGLVDTEHERSLVYEGMEYNGERIGQFWHYNLTAPYTIPRYEKAMDELKATGCEVIIIDSTSHAWEGEGGVLEYQQAQGGRFQDWLTANKDAYFPMVKLFTGEKHGIHVINTMRTKQEHAMQPDDNGKMQVVKLGMKPIQRDTLEYEFQVVFSVDMEHTAVTSKDNSSMFTGKRFQLNSEIGSQLQKWLGTGVDIHAERRAIAEQAEKERVEYANALREYITANELTEFVKTGYEEHASINRPLEQFPMEFLKKVDAVLQQKIKQAEETAEGVN